MDPWITCDQLEQTTITRAVRNICENYSLQSLGTSINKIAPYVRHNYILDCYSVIECSYDTFLSFNILLSSFFRCFACFQLLAIIKALLFNWIRRAVTWIVPNHVDPPCTIRYRCLLVRFSFFPHLSLVLFGHLLPVGLVVSRSIFAILLTRSYLFLHLRTIRSPICTLHCLRTNWQ